MPKTNQTDPERTAPRAKRMSAIASSDELLPLVYDELRRLANAQLAREAPGQTLQPTALVHEAWMKLNHRRKDVWNNRTHFFRAAAQAMRRILVDKSREKASLKRGQHAEKVSLDEAAMETITLDRRVLLVDEALSHLEAEEPESARLVILKFFGGFTNREIGEILGMGERSVERQWAYCKARIYQLIQKLDKA